MWKFVDVNKQDCFIKYERKEELHTIYFSDVVNVWIEELSSLSLSHRCKEMNSLIEAEEEDLVKHVYNLVDNKDGTLMQISSNASEETRTLHLESQLAGIPFYFMFRMWKMDANSICKELTCPLMILALQQQDQITQLCDMLVAKDTEIEQYKLEGALLTKKKVETLPFNKIMLHKDREKVANFPYVTNPTVLFQKICSYLPVIDKGNQNSSNSNDKIEHKSDVQSQLTESSFYSTASKIASTVENEEKCNSSLKQKSNSNKKQRLQI